jgi:hypothetical protein
LQRALKFSKLFQQNNFDPIMDALVPKIDENAFRIACKNAGLVSAEIDWLWNYLQRIGQINPNTKEAFWGPKNGAPEAAGTGW